jgi:hypothetical protein
MILPTKRLSLDKSLLGTGGNVLACLDRPKTVSRLWEDLQQATSASGTGSRVGYDWFVLTLDLLFCMNAIELREGELRRSC